MDSANLHQLQDQLQLVGSSSSSSSLDNNSHPSCYEASSVHQWSPGGISLNCVSLSHNFNNEMLNTRDENNNNNNSTSECMSLSNIHNHSLIQQQDFPLQWTHNESSYHHHEGLHKIKEELSSATTSDHQQGMPRFTDMLNSPVITNYLKINEHKDYTEKLLLNTISSGFPINGDYSNSLPSSSSSSSPSSQSHRGSFSQIYPSVNISSLSESQRISNIPRPFDMNMQVLDGRLFEGNVLVPPLNSQEIRGNFTPFGLPFHHHLQQTLHHPSSSPSHQMEIYSNEPQASEGKRHNFVMAPKAGETASKKPRVESRSSCPPFKVRKEKLGDRIAALQQLVSPFGKTDTASVLMEAIGYIKFLQSQIETLSVPYMRASRNRPGKASQLGSIPQEGDEEETRDLRSRGLCLVPLSCMTYVTGDGGDGGGGVGSGFWPTPPGFGGGT
ncbi:PREDICTED: transcription factor bHLH110 isoform X1 [Brassica oleracea var. oleracea]|uniref:BHLH domain-containing protein n=1 Tax=Brassica oleracea var. oleracea TaxID=109376 RepID=A0A0D3BIG7_BRAOL|nr:PREDICTED: transcription factor bHLH110 isoform X1 [Brassica oleracea var. oleracea]